MSVASQIESHSSCLLWLETLRTDNTRKNFKLHISLFCRFANTDPDLLLALTDDQIKQKLIEYIVHMKRNAKRKAEKPKAGEISVNSIRTYLGGVQSFLQFHEREFNWKKLFSYLPETVTCKLRAYTLEEIRRLLEFSDPRDRAIILIMASGGVRRGAFPFMKVSDVRKIEDSAIGLLNVYPDSDKDHYVTLLTPECMDAINQYLEWRRQHGEKISGGSPLIRDKFDVFSKHRNEPKVLGEESIYAQVARVVKKAGVYAEDLAPDHSFRYFFNTTLMNSDVNHQFKALMMGHSIDLDDVYFKADTPQSRKKILAEYAKAVDFLTIYDEHRLKNDLSVAKNTIHEKDAIISKYESIRNEFANVLQVSAAQAKRITELESRLK